MKKSRWLTLAVAAVAGAVSQWKPQYGDLLYGALAMLGWAAPHPADKQPGESK